MTSLAYIVSEIKAANFENFQAILNLALTTASAIVVGVVPRENVPVDLAVKALDALSTLHTQALSVASSQAGSGVDPQLWSAAWQPLLQAISSLCTSPDRVVRQSGEAWRGGVDK